MTALLDRALDVTRRFADRVAMRLAHGTPAFGAAPPQPPGPTGSVLLGSLVEGWNRPLELFSRCMLEHGPIARLRFGPAFYYLLNDPELVRHVFVENHRNYKKSRNYQGFRIVLGDGLFTSEGELWRRQRKLEQPAFHRERLAGFAGAMTDSTRGAIAGLRALAGTPVQVAEAMSRLSLRIVLRTLFTSDVDEESDALREAVSFVNEFGESAFFLPAWLPTAKNRNLRRALAVFDRLAARLIAARRAGRDGAAGKSDLLTMLMTARDEATGEPMSDRLIRDEALTLVIGGHETTATVLTWTFYLLSLYPEVERRLRAHVLEVIGDRDPTADDVPRLGYVAQVLQESMRLYPPAWVMEREALADDEVGGFRIPAGATVAVCPYVLHRHPDHWTHPDGFDPDRFSPERSRDRSRYVYLPFGAGPRQCIGNVFGMMETVIIVSMVVRELRLELVPGHKVELEPLTTLRSKYGMRMVPRLAR